MIKSYYNQSFSRYFTLHVRCAVDIVLSRIDNDFDCANANEVLFDASFLKQIYTVLMKSVDTQLIVMGNLLLHKNKTILYKILFPDKSQIRRPLAVIFKKSNVILIIEKYKYVIYEAARALTKRVFGTVKLKIGCLLVHADKVKIKNWLPFYQYLRDVFQ